MQGQEERPARLSSSFNPATGELLGVTPEDSPEILRVRVAAAKQAQKGWGAISFDVRKNHLLKIRDYLVDNADEIASIVSQSTGKTRVDAMATEVFPTALTLTYYATHAKAILKRKHLSAGSILTINKRSYVDRAPYGVIGIISPWNYPLAIPFHEIAMALMAGNGVVLKVATQTLEVGKVMERAVKAGGLPDGLFSQVNLPGRVAGDAFIESGIDKLFFTGSVTVGKALMAKAALRLLPISLELGGNDAMIVLRDADLERAAGGALWAGFSNAGQSCAGVERIYVERDVYEPFVNLLKEKVSALRQGNDADFNVDVGSLTMAEQLHTVLRHIQDAREKGAGVFAPEGKSGTGKGLFHPPVILENVHGGMLYMQEETFGPVVSVAPFDSIAEAVRLANDSPLGLTASVWTKDRRKGHAIAAGLEVGSVTINDHLMSHGLAETPWGGWKESGYGRTHGYLGLEAMTQPRTVIDDILPGVKKQLWWFPYSRDVYEGLKGGLSFLYGKGLAIRMTGMYKLTKIFFRTFSVK
jgi:succinate-semialdehyde dehydrogenase/glutarate-semialdehyde dehydrogenase